MSTLREDLRSVSRQIEDALLLESNEITIRLLEGGRREVETFLSKKG